MERKSANQSFKRSLTPMILFIHIPKTAGTSFRNGLLNVFSRNEILFDYGFKAPETDREILDLYNQDKTFSPHDVANVALSRKARVLCGHFPLQRYAHVFPDARPITFIREPLQRCYSEYLHLRRHQSFDRSFREFISQTRNHNLQSRFLKDWPEDGFLGISEKYPICLQELAPRFGLEVPLLTHNTHRLKVDVPYPLEEIGEEEATRFYEMNQEDVVLYNRVAEQWPEEAPQQPTRFGQKLRHLARLLRS